MTRLAVYWYRELEQLQPQRIEVYAMPESGSSSCESFYKIIGPDYEIPVCSPEAAAKVIKYLWPSALKDPYLSDPGA